MAKPKRRLFIVDDDTAQNDMLRKFLLEKFDVEILAFASGEDAWRNINLNPTYVIMDYYLDRANPGVANGVEFLKQIRQAYPKTHVIMLSTQDKIDVAVDTMKYGAFDYVVKSPAGFLRIENNMNHINKAMRRESSIKSLRTAVLVLSIIVFIGALVAFLILQNGSFV